MSARIWVRAHAATLHAGVTPQPCAPQRVLVVPGGFACRLGRGSVRGSGAAPRSLTAAFLPQENSEVFLSAVDTDWKVGLAVGRGQEVPPSPWAWGPTGQRGGSVRGTERALGMGGVGCPNPSLQVVAAWCPCMGLCATAPVGRGHGPGFAVCPAEPLGMLAAALSAGTQMCLVGTWQHSGDKSFLKEAKPSCFSSPSAIAMVMVPWAMPAPRLHEGG